MRGSAQEIDVLEGRWPERRLLRRTVWGVIVIAVGGGVLAILRYVAGGIIGNGAYALLPSIWSSISKAIEVDIWPWLITLIVLLIGISGMLYYWQQSRLLKNTLNTVNEIVKLDDSLMRQLVSATSAPDLKIARRRVLERLLQNATEAFPEDAYKASILLPDINEEYLEISASYQMSNESIEKARFYIGKDENKISQRGTAGLTYLDEKVRVGHVKHKEEGFQAKKNKRKSDSWEWNAEGYIVFGEKRPYPSHYSFIAMPIIGVDQSFPAEKTTCFGVVCFDGYDPRVFDSPLIKNFLQTFVIRIAAALTMFMQLTQPSN